MSDINTWIKIIGVPAGKEEDRLPRQEFEGLVLPSITSDGREKEVYIVCLLDALAIIDAHRPILFVWLEEKYPENVRHCTNLIFEAEICKEVTKDEPVFNFC